MTHGVQMSHRCITRRTRPWPFDRTGQLPDAPRTSHPPTSHSPRSARTFSGSPMPQTAIRCSECGTSLEDPLHACPHCGSASPVARTAEGLLGATPRPVAVDPEDPQQAPILAELRATLEPRILILKPLARGGMGL